MQALPCPLTAATELLANPSWRAIDLLSDLHLSDAAPATFDAWASHLRHSSADAIFILGDLFDYWAGADTGQLPFEARCLAVLEQAARGKHVALMVGNRDFLVTPALLASVGVHALHDPTLLRAFDTAVLLTHGDALCLGDVAYQQFRAWSRVESRQREFLARPLAERVRMAQGLRHASEAGRQRQAPAASFVDVDAAAAVACLRQAGAACMVHGHTHRPGDWPLAPGFERKVLSDWDLDQPPLRAEVLRFSHAGFARLPPSRPPAAA